jgi:hypothetical protein
VEIGIPETPGEDYIKYLQSPVSSLPYRGLQQPSPLKTYTALTATVDSTASTK